MRNVFTEFLSVVPRVQVETGTVVAADSASVVVELPGGARVTARGVAAVNSRVYLRGRTVDGPAPTLASFNVEI